MWKAIDIPTMLISCNIDEQDKEMLAKHFQEVVSVVNDSITTDMAMREAAKFFSQRAYETLSKLVE
ncbi:hypothetical protein ACIQ34_07345 [Ureibacillus sp. NPDC094379]